MTRAEYNEFRFVRYQLKRINIGRGTTLTIPTNGGSEYKKALHDLYTGWGFHPASIKVDERMYDDNERIIYIYGLTFELDGKEHPWTELYTKEEKAAFAAALC